MTTHPLARSIPHPDRRVAFDLLLRAAAIALVAAAIMGLLPVIAELAA